MIKLEHVSKTFPDGTEAVKDVSFEVEEGQICVLLGPSGCGKTTTMKMINRLIPLTSGKIFIDGTDVYEMDENELRMGIGYAIQSVELFPHMTVGENIQTVPSLKKWSREKREKRVEELLKLFKIDVQFKDKYPRELSGGQQQRVGVARALGADPPVLLMDEPFGAIDPITRVKLQDEFLRIHEDIKKTVIFVTHDIHEAIKMGERIALMKEGRLVQYGQAADLVFTPKNDFAAAFVGRQRVIQGLQLLEAGKVMQPSPLTVSADETSREIRRKMTEKETDIAAVLDAEGRPLGSVHLLDLEKGGTGGDIADEHRAVTDSRASLDEVVSLMLTAGARSVLIADQENRLQGMVDFRTVQNRIREVMENTGEKES